MNTLYPVLFTKTKDMILIEIPDLVILTQGQDMNHAFTMAKNAAELMCASLLETGVEIPEPTDVFDMDLTKATYYRDGKTILALLEVDPRRCVIDY